MLSRAKTDGGLNSDCKRRLERAMLLYLRYPVTSATVPLFPDLKLHPHLQFLDSGLLNHVLRTTGLYFKDEDLSVVSQGCLAEQVVGQELLAQWSVRCEKPLYCTSKLHHYLEFVLHSRT